MDTNSRLLALLAALLVACVGHAVAGEFLIASSDGVFRSEIVGGKQLARPEKLSDHRLTWLALSGDAKSLYGGSERSDEGDTNAALSAFRFGDDGTLRFLNQLPVDGKTPCFVDIDRAGRTLLLTNFRQDTYTSRGSVIHARVAPDGNLGEVVDRFTHPGKGGSDSNRQLASHPHSIVIHPNQKWAAVGDLGVDRIHIYRLDGDKAEMAHAHSVAARPGQQPRHVRWHPNGRFLYCMNEAADSVSVVAFDPATGEGKFIQHIKRGGGGGADLAIDPRGRYLYGSNRGPDTIVGYRIDAGSGKLTLIGHWKSGGKSTRSLAIDPSGGFLLAANQGSGNLRAFSIAPTTGELTRFDEELEVKAPACVRFLPSTAK